MIFFINADSSCPNQTLLIFLVNSDSSCGNQTLTKHVSWEQMKKNKNNKITDFAL